MRTLAVILVVVCALSVPCLFAREIIIQVPEGMRVDAAEATPAKSDSAIDGVVSGNTARVKNVQPDLAYDVALTLADQSVLQGVDMRWYSLEPAKADAGE